MEEAKAAQGQQCFLPVEAGINQHPEEEMTMGVLRVMSGRGDDQVVWERHKITVGDPEALAAVREAERIFEEQRAHGATAFAVENGSTLARINQFDVEAEQIVLVPRVVGG
jgi:hypothetical protein